MLTIPAIIGGIGGIFVFFMLVEIAKRIIRVQSPNRLLIAPFVETLSFFPAVHASVMTDSASHVQKGQHHKAQPHIVIKPGQKPTPDNALLLLKEGNARFLAGTPQHPHIDLERLALAGNADQGDYAYATVVACSDSRVPVELIFDAGVMDIFVIRVAGNICSTTEIGSIEYGLAHVHTPVLVILGHSKCGAVTAVTRSLSGEPQSFEENILPLVENITPAVERAMEKHQELQRDDLIPYAIEENVWHSIETLLRQSSVTRNLINSGKVKVVGGMYDIATGRVNWLDAVKAQDILKQVEISLVEDAEEEVQFLTE